MEKERYQEACERLLQEILQYSPEAEALLNQIRERSGARLAYYAAFVIVCLEASVQKDGYRAVEHLQFDDLRSYTFFELCSADDEARQLFTQSLECYQADCQRRFNPVNLIPYPASLPPSPAQ